MIATLFVSVPLTLVFFVMSFGAFAASGGVAAIERSRNRLLRLILTPLKMIDLGEVTGTQPEAFWTRIMFFPGLLLFSFSVFLVSRRL